MGRNPEQNQQAKAQRNHQILSAALHVFSKRGLSGTKISHIAKAANMSQGLLYRYFSSKEEIFTALVKTALDRLHEASQNLETMHATPVEKIRMAFTEILSSIESNEYHSYYHLLITQANVSEAIPPEAHVILQDKYRYPYEVLERIIIQGQHDHTIRPGNAFTMATLFWTTITGLAIFRASHPLDFRVPDIDILMSMYTASPETP